MFRVVFKLFCQLIDQFQENSFKLHRGLITINKDAY